MATDAKTTGKTFLAGVLAKLPAEQRAPVQTAFEAAESAAALEALGGGVLAQAEFSREMDGLTAWKKQLDDWFAEKQADLTELSELKAGKRTLTGVPVVPAVVPAAAAAAAAAPAIDFDAEFNKRIGRTEQDAIAFFAELNQLSQEHLHRFNEVLDTRALVTDKRAQQLGLRGVYHELHKEQITARADADKKVYEDKLRAEGAAAARAAMASTTQPFPITGNEVSSLDALEAARAGQTPKVATVDDMTAELARLSGLRAATA